MNMATRHRLFVLLTVLWTLTTNGEGVPVVTSIHQTVENNMRNITLHYEAEVKPVILWKIYSFVSHFDNSTNTFSGSHGQATLYMYIHPRDIGIDMPITASIYSDSYQLSLVFKEGDIQYSSSESNSLRPLLLRTQPEGLIDYDAGEVVNIDMTVESQDLGSLEITRSWSRINTFDYEAIPPSQVFRDNIWWPTNRLYRGEEQNSFIMLPLNISGASSTSETTRASIDTRFNYTDGEVEFVVHLRVNSQYSLLDKVSIRSWVYLKETTQEGPFRGTMSFVQDPQNRKRVDTVSDRILYTQSDAMGFPKPVLSIYRDCTELAEPEIEVISIGTPFRTRNIFRFKNATEDLTGAYYFHASSGDRTITKLNYIEQL